MIDLIYDLDFDPGHGGKVERTCVQCGRPFLIYSSYIKKGKGKFCSNSCTTTFRNLRDNPSKRPEVKAKISANHADVSGKNNPMYGRRGSNAPSFIDGRNNFVGDIWRRIALANKDPTCEVCNSPVSGRRMHVHHKDKDHGNSDLDNLMIVCVVCHNNILHKRKRDAKGRFVKEAV